MNARLKIVSSFHYFWMIVAIVNRVQLFMYLFWNSCGFQKNRNCFKEVDSDDEWQSFIDVTDPSNDPEPSLSLMSDKHFISKLKSRLSRVMGQMMDGMLDGAAKLRAVLRVITNLITLKWWPSNSLQLVVQSLSISFMHWTAVVLITTQQLNFDLNLFWLLSKCHKW